MKLMSIIFLIFLAPIIYAENYIYVINCKNNSTSTSDLLLKWSNNYVEKIQHVKSKSIKTGEELKFDMNISFKKSSLISITSRFETGRAYLSAYSNEGIFGPAYYTYEILKYKSSNSSVFEKMVSLSKTNEILNAQTNYFKNCEIKYN